MSASNAESSVTSSIEDEIAYEYNCDSTFDEESTTTDEDAVLTDLIRKELLQTNNPTRSTSGKQMTAGEIAALLMKVRLEDDIAPGPNRVGDNYDLASSFSVISSKANEKADVDSKVNHPQTVLDNILKQNGYKSDKILFENIPEDFFLHMTDENLKSYTKDTLKAVRMKDVEKLGQYLSEGKNLQCCNNFGESIISMACREGATNVIDFLLNKANVSIQICDDYGKTPLHNACWTSEPDFDLVSLLIRKCADLFIICDKRGHTPLDYVRIDQYEKWESFLWGNKDLIQPTILGERMP